MKVLLELTYDMNLVMDGDDAIKIAAILTRSEKVSKTWEGEGIYPYKHKYSNRSIPSFTITPFDEVAYTAMLAEAALEK